MVPKCKRALRIERNRKNQTARRGAEAPTDMPARQRILRAAFYFVHEAVADQRTIDASSATRCQGVETRTLWLFDHKHAMLVAPASWSTPSRMRMPLSVPPARDRYRTRRRRLRLPAARFLRGLCDPANVLALLPLCHCRNQATCAGNRKGAGPSRTDWPRAIAFIRISEGRAGERPRRCRRYERGRPNDSLRSSGADCS